MTEIRTVDALGTHCPVPVRLLARAAARRTAGTLVELLADDPLTEIDVPAWCHAHRHELVATTRDGDVWSFLVRIRTAHGPRG